jgi:polyisoprenoid-binding protein YceI
VGEARSETFEGRSSFAGTLKLHGVSKAIGGSAELKREASGVRVTASFPLLLTDFGIEPPQYMGVGVGNRLQVKVTFLAAGAR